MQEGQYETTVPTVRDRVAQAAAKIVLEPIFEADFVSCSYGFRPGRSCQDAIEAIYRTGKGVNAARLWVLDADLAAALDVVPHCSFR